MSSFLRSLLTRSLAILVVPLFATLFIGADEPPDEARVRLQSMSAKERSELVETLKQFDLQLPLEQQRSLRQIDQQISRLSADEKVRYLAALRRYHNWLDSLPDSVRDKLQAKPPADRMAQIRTMLSRYPLPKQSNPVWMQFADIAGTSPFELATTFMIWQELAPQERRELEGLPAGPQRRQKLNDYGRARKLREIRPADFRLEHWIPKVEAKIDEIQLADPELKNALTKAENLTKRKNEGKDQSAHLPSPLMRRLAINLYFMEEPPPRPVDPQRLAQFFAAMPPWIRSSFDSYTADEARRRLTLVYRLVFPKDEYTPVRPGASVPLPASPTASKSTAVPPAPVPVQPKKEATVPKAPGSPGSSPF